MIVIDQEIWKRGQEKAKPGSEVYYDGKGVKLVNFKIGYDKELYPLLNDVDQVRSYFRSNYAVNKIGLIQCDIISIASHRSIKTVSKRSEPNMPNWYMASITIPLKKRSYVLTLYSEESDAEYSRENTVIGELKKQENVEFDDHRGLPKDWSYDPYAKEYFGPSLYNLSDNEYYDQEYPDHALSKLRRRLNQLESSIEVPVDDDLEGNSWWKIWKK